MCILLELLYIVQLYGYNMCAFLPRFNPRVISVVKYSCILRSTILFRTRSEYSQCERVMTPVSCRLLPHDSRAHGFDLLLVNPVRISYVYSRMLSACQWRLLLRTKIVNQAHFCCTHTRTYLCRGDLVQSRL